ncbi:MAG TPA: TetR/AcrR family transcriptional regulator [Helicobacteraceae bacterium]|nr:TetR/AcrR family transcriptional regulator [Helicobacteraceae bacterium]
MSTQKHDTYHHGNLKESLIQTALEMVHHEGVEAITLRELSTRLGTSRSAIYRHFEGKDALMKAVILAGFDKLDAVIEPLFNPENKMPLIERFHDMGVAYITFATDAPNLYRLLFGPIMSQQREEACIESHPELHQMMHGDSSEALIDRESSDGFHKLVLIIVQAQQEKIFKAGDPILIATAIWSLLHGLAMLVIDGHLSVSNNVQAIYETNYKLLLEGLSIR